MDSAEIEKIMAESRVARKYFLGCFPADGIPRPQNFPYSLIVNEDPKTQRGSHWTGLFVPNKEQAIYFDSYGRDPIDHIYEYLLKFKHVISNKTKFQSIFSNVCPHYCIFFIYCMTLGIPFDKFLLILKRKDNPDLFVKFFVRSVLK